MNIVTTEVEDREGKRLLEEALHEAYSAGYIAGTGNRPQDIPCVDDLWIKLMNAVGINV